MWSLNPLYFTDKLIKFIDYWRLRRFIGHPVCSRINKKQSGQEVETLWWFSVLYHGEDEEEWRRSNRTEHECKLKIFHLFLTCCLTLRSALGDKKRVKTLFMQQIQASSSSEHVKRSTVFQHVRSTCDSPAHLQAVSISLSKPTKTLTHWMLQPCGTFTTPLPGRWLFIILRRVKSHDRLFSNSLSPVWFQS